MARLDLAALRTLKEVLGGFVWALEALGSGRAVTFSEFALELFGAVEATSYRAPTPEGHSAVLVADVVQARGVSFRAVAVMGVAEGEFPAPRSEDPFLRDDDRVRLREEFGLDLEPSTSSSEAGYFYETITHPTDKLLLTRPRLADNGARWQPSPFWQEVRRLISLEPQVLTSDSVPPLGAVASATELMGSLAANRSLDTPAGARPQSDDCRLRHVFRSADVFASRYGRRVRNVHDGDLSGLATSLQERYGASQVWSASRLEGYRACPFFFYVAYALGLQPREQPAEGLDARQLGNIYHHILEEVFKSPGVTDPSDMTQVQAALRAVSATVLDDAPAREGFRETAWWQQTREEIVADLQATLEALEEVSEGFRPIALEARFGGDSALTVMDGQDAIRLRGYIDRVDLSSEGIRVIDYKTAGPGMYGKKALQEGKKLQIALYALAARDALMLGEPIDAFYWHIRHAVPSPLRLGEYEGGLEEALRDATDWVLRTVRAIREGRFEPEPADGRCPGYCPAAAFCWRFSPPLGD